MRGFGKCYFNVGLICDIYSYDLVRVSGFFRVGGFIGFREVFLGLLFVCFLVKLRERLWVL